MVNWNWPWDEEPSGETKARQESQEANQRYCSHPVMKEYIGFSERYWFCEYCDYKDFDYTPPQYRKIDWRD